jgi:type I restriction enzyme S subunit
MADTAWPTKTLGEVAFECKDRVGANTDGLSVYGVDRHEGLTGETRYVAATLDRYKLIEPGMFAYNPMRLNIGSIGFCKPTYSRGLVSPDYIVFGCKPGQLLPEFLDYAIRGPEWRQWTAHAGVGSVRQRIYFKELARLPLTIPSYEAQIKIASVLSALDDKIESNRRMNQTLEALARTLFKKLFVDATATRLPSGWRTSKLRDCCERVENGGTPKRDEPTYWSPATIPWLTSGEVRQAIVTKTDNFISSEGLENSSAKLWPAATTVVALYGATAGQVCFLGDTMCSNQACCGLIPKKDMRYYIYLHASSSVAAFEHQTRGSAQQNLSQQIVADFPTVIPDDDALAGFDKLVHPLFSRRIANLHESRTLAELRDTLLPKLLSGELGVPTTMKPLRGKS